VLAVLGAVGSYAGVALARRTDDGPNPNPSATANAGQSAAPAAGSGRQIPADEQCTAAIQRNPRWVCLTRATLSNDRIVIDYRADFAGSTPNVHGGFHLHIYGGDGTNPAEDTEGAQSAVAGNWYVEDQKPSVRTVDSHDFTTAIGTDAKKVCARIANGRHRLVPDNDGGFHTGNCVPIQRI